MMKIFKKLFINILIIKMVYINVKSLIIINLYFLLMSMHLKQMLLRQVLKIIFIILLIVIHLMGQLALHRTF
jgi:hypothetical protein